MINANIRDEIEKLLIHETKRRMSLEDQLKETDVSLSKSIQESESLKQLSTSAILC